MPKPSAGILAYRRSDHGLEFLLAHPGGPFWGHRDEGAWSIPKGEHEPDESAMDAALREYAEETGFAPAPPYLPLGTVIQSSGKHVSAWAMETDVDASLAQSNLFEIEWPRHSGKLASFPEMDRAEWFSADMARVKLIPSQVAFIERAIELLGG